jgi:mono/diheme cytochrome c family protein
MLRFNLCLVALLLLPACQSRQEAALEPADPGRGGLLYETACVQCHTTQAHWRDKRIVNSWDSLLEQVDRWRKVGGHRWSEADIRDVASHLNERFYKLPAPGKS